MFEVGTHQYKKRFQCRECAKRYYREIKDMNLTYLMDISKNVILLNTYGWLNGE